MRKWPPRDKARPPSLTHAQARMLAELASGLIPVLATPFHPSGELDLESLHRLVDFQVASGADGVAVFGFASEGFALTLSERRSILDVVTKAGLPPGAGCGR